jgi:glycosyltransferase involved in cell wall biosynthesis
MLLGARVAVVVPAHDEARFVGRVIGRMPAFVDRVLVVDDASTDGTAEACRAAGDPRVRLVRHERNLGVGAAIATGYREARRAGADVVAVMAGDDQMHPDDLERLLLPVVRGEVGYTKGDRLHHPDAARVMPWARRLGTLVLGWLTRLALGARSLSDSQCGYTAISARAIGELDLDRLWPRFGYPNDLLGQLASAGVSFADVVVRPVYQGERSELGARHVPIILWLIARTAWRTRRAVPR